MAVPSDISGLQFWVKSDTGITKDGSNFVSQWDDQSGNSRHLTEATNKPLWVDALVNGYPAIRFDGSNDKLTSTSFSVAQALTVFMVVKAVGHTNLDGYWFSNGNGPGMYQGTSPVVKIHDTFVGSDGATVNSGGAVFELYKAIFNGTSSVLALNDGADQTSGTNLSNGIASGVVVGAWPGGGIRFGNIEVAEIAIYNSAISGTNLTDLKDYFGPRYNLGFGAAGHPAVKRMGGVKFAARNQGIW